MSAAGATTEEVVTEEPGEVVTVETPEPEEEGGEAAPAAAASEEQRQNHKERKQNRMREAKEAKEVAERTARDLSDRVARAERETAELRGFVAAQAQRGQGDPDAAVKQKVTALRREAQIHLERTAAFQKAGQHDAAQAEMDLYHDKIDEAREVRRAPQREADLNRRISEVTGRIPTPEIQMARENILQEFPWVRTDVEARAMVDAKFEALKASGRPGTFDTIREAAAAVAKRLGIGGRQAPTQESRQRHQAVPSGEGAGGGDGAVQVPWGAAEKKLAEKLFPRLDPPAAKKAFLAEMARAKRAGEY